MSGPEHDRFVQALDLLGQIAEVDIPDILAGGEITVGDRFALGLFVATLADVHRTLGDMLAAVQLFTEAPANG